MRILIIEDDADISDILFFALKQAYFAVDRTADGEVGALMGKRNDYDLIILDYMLPKKNGYEICREIRSAGKTVPIMILSVRNETADKVTLLNEGADDYLAKPFSLEELMARVKALLRRPHRMESPVITVGDITIDSDSQLVRSGKKEINLTRKEFSLLEYIARHRGTVVSRGMLMEHVWDKELDLFSNTIESHILNLRKKLGSQAKLISTVPGRGYKIKA